MKIQPDLLHAIYTNSFSIWLAFYSQIQDYLNKSLLLNLGKAYEVQTIIEIYRGMKLLLIIASESQSEEEVEG